MSNEIDLKNDKKPKIKGSIEKTSHLVVLPILIAIPVQNILNEKHV